MLRIGRTLGQSEYLSHKMNEIHHEIRTMRRLPPLHALRAFEAAARHLHFSKAAEELALTPTAISHHVRQLEALLGVQLFHRYPRPVRLTADGAALYPVLRDALDEIAAKIAELSKSGDAEPLVVSVTLAFASRWLMPRLQRLQNETGLRITVEADDRIANLHGDTVDLAIRYCASPSSGGRWQRLFQDHFIPVAAPMLCPAGVEELAVHDIAKLPLIHYRWKNQTLDAPDWQKWFSFAIKARTQIAVAQEFSEEVLAIDAAVAGQGVVLASQVLVSDLLASGQLVQLSPMDLPGPSCWAVHLSSHPRQAEINRLIEWMRQSHIVD